jgi:hypothetical protein
MRSSISRVCALAVFVVAVLGLATPARALVNNLQISVSGLGASGVPEPVSVLLVGVALIAIGAGLRRRSA